MERNKQIDGIGGKLNSQSDISVPGVTIAFSSQVFQVGEDRYGITLKLTPFGGGVEVGIAVNSLVEFQGQTAIATGKYSTWDFLFEKLRSYLFVKL